MLKAATLVAFVATADAARAIAFYRDTLVRSSSPTRRLRSSCAPRA